MTETVPASTGPSDGTADGSEPQGPQQHRAEPGRSGRPLAWAEGLTPVSPRLLRARILGNLWWLLLMVAGAIALVVLGAVLGGWWWYPLALLPLAADAWWLVLVGRRVRAIGYATRADDMVIAHGIMFRNLTVVPYGRIQSVEVDQGPIERRYGLASISITTAASLDTTVLPGLPHAEAYRLRDLLSSHGTAKMAGL